MTFSSKTQTMQALESEAQKMVQLPDLQVLFDQLLACRRLLEGPAPDGDISADLVARQQANLAHTITAAQSLLDALQSAANDQKNEPTAAIKRFSEQEISGVYRAIRERRDMRHFIPDPIDPQQLLRFIEAAHQGPSVGFMQPWRFIRIVDPALKQLMHQHVDEERQRTAEALGERGRDFMRLKVEGLLSCGELLVVALTDQREQHIFGRRTMPEMDLASVSCAIQNFWLAARAEGIGVGWVSLFDPDFIRTLCGMPEGSKPIALLCVGHVAAFYPAPMLALEGWDQRRVLDEIMFQNRWGQVVS